MATVKIEKKSETAGEIVRVKHEGIERTVSAAIEELRKRIHSKFTGAIKIESSDDIVVNSSVRSWVKLIERGRASLWGINPFVLDHRILEVHYLVELDKGVSMGALLYASKIAPDVIEMLESLAESLGIETVTLRTEYD